MLSYNDIIYENLFAIKNNAKNDLLELIKCKMNDIYERVDKSLLAKLIYLKTMKFGDFNKRRRQKPENNLVPSRVASMSIFFWGQ